MTFQTIIRQPGAFVPLVMSLAALALVLVHVALSGAVHEADEGAAAHIFQLLIAAQLPVMGLFAIKWLPRATRASLAVLVLQVAAIVVALAPVGMFKL